MGTKAGMAKAVAKAIANNPNFLKTRAAKGGKAVKKENRAFSKDRKLAQRAGRKRNENKKRG